MASLTDKQKIYVDTLLEAIEGGLSVKEAKQVAKKAAGYADSTLHTEILTDEVVQEIIRRQNTRIALTLPVALDKIDNILENPQIKGSAVLLAAATAILDRGGLSKKDSTEVTLKAPVGLVYLPSKKPLDAEDPNAGLVETPEG